MLQFEELGLAPAMLKNIAELGYETPTPIQVKAIPVLLEGRDLMGLAQTGTGKTAAFGLPLAQLLIADRQKPQPRGVRALILAPTRELANQIAENLREYVRRTPMRVGIVVGGQSMRNQVKMLEKGVDILVATPGRLIDHAESGTVDISTARFLVLDEADQMLDLGFIHALKQIAKLVGKPRQTMLFSATMPKPIAALAANFLTDPVRVEVTPPGKTADRVRQFMHFVPQGEKGKLLARLLSRDGNDLSLVFARTKHGAEKLMKNLVAAGLPAASVHGNKSQGQRERALREFRDGAVRILVATDVAARGIDIPGVSHVYNFDLPQVAEIYVHRIGRTARAGREGIAVSFCAPDEVKLLRAIEKLTGIEIEKLNEPAARAPRDEADMAEAAAPQRRNQPRRGRQAQGESSRNGGQAAGREAGRSRKGGNGRRGEAAQASGNTSFGGLARALAGGPGEKDSGAAKPVRFGHREGAGAAKRNRRPGRRAAQA